MLQALDRRDERRQVDGHHPLAQVAEVDHRHDAVPAALPGGGLLQRHHDLELALQRDVGVADRLVGQRRDRRPQEPDGRRQAAVTQSLDVLQPRLAEGHGAGGQHRGAHLGTAGRRLDDADHLDPGEPLDHGARIVADLAEIDRDRRVREHGPPLHRVYAGEYSEQAPRAPVSIFRPGRPPARVRILAASAT